MKNLVGGNMAENERVLLKVTDNPDGVYSVTVAQGSSISEVAFCMTVVIKCLIKTGYIKSAQEMYDFMDKYMNDPQYEEVKNEEQLRNSDNN